MKVFISAVTSEFGRARDLLANGMQSRPIEVRVQRSFVHEHGAETLLDQLHGYIAGADRVVAIVGRYSGTFPEEAEIRPAYRALLPQGMTRASYTQWEVIFGLHYHPGSTKIHIAAADYQADAAAPGDDLANQAALLAHISAKGLLRRPFSNADQLRANVLEERWPEPISHRPKNLPFSSIGARFIGREDFMSALDQTFHGSTRAVAIYGMGGLGKTRTAIEYTLSRENQFTALLFLSAKSPDAIEAGLAALVGPLMLDLPEQAVTEQHRQAAAAVRWLQGHAGWLLLLDNVDNEVAAKAAEDLVAKLSGGQVLITTRIDAWGPQVEVLSLGFLSQKASVDLLLASTPNRRKTPGDATEAAFLAEEVDRLCLALVQAAANIDTRRLTLPAYRAEWEKNKTKMLLWHDERKLGYPLPVAVTWATTIDQLSEGARQLLNQLSYLSHEPIPESLMDVVVDGDEAGAIARRAALDELARYSMALRDPDKPEFAIHRLVQLVNREMLGVDYGHHADTFLGRLLRLVSASRSRSKCRNATENFILSLMRSAMPGVNTSDVRSWPSFEPLVTHLEALARHIAMGAQQDLSIVLTYLASFYQGKANFRKAEPLYRRALHIGESSLGTDHPKIAGCLINLAGLLQDTNRLDEAEPLLRRALRIDEATVGRDHPRVATGLSNLASLLCATDRLNQAEPLFRRALQIDEASFGPNHPQVAIRLSHLGELLSVTFRLSEAMLLFRRSGVVMLNFLKSNGHRHPRQEVCFKNYIGSLATAGLSQPQINSHFASLYDEAGLPRPEGL